MSVFKSSGSKQMDTLSTSSLSCVNSICAMSSFARSQSVSSSFFRQMVNDEFFGFSVMDSSSSMRGTPRVTFAFMATPLPAV